MALRQFIRKCSPLLWSYASLSIKPSCKDIAKRGNLSGFSWDQSTPLLLVRDKDATYTRKLDSLVTARHAASSQTNQFIDLFTNSPHKSFYMPTITINTLKVYEDTFRLPKSITDNRIIISKIDPILPEQPLKKEAHRMIRIRRRKMRKHKLKKLRKKMKFVFAKIKLKRQLRKEQAFRTELLTQIEAADNFNAKEYVSNIIHTLRNQPKPETVLEHREKYRLKMKKHKYHTIYIRPNFDD